MLIFFSFNINTPPNPLKNNTLFLFSTRNNKLQVGSMRKENDEQYSGSNFESVALNNNYKVICLNIKTESSYTVLGIISYLKLCIENGIESALSGTVRQRGENQTGTVSAFSHLSTNGDDR